MSQLYAEHTVWELLISLGDPSDPIRRKAGDVVEVRRPSGPIGRREAKEYMAIRVTGLEEVEMNQLRQAVKEVPGGPGFDLNRYCIPFARLQAFDPDFDEVRARNQTDDYQPFAIFDETDGTPLVQNRPPLPVHGLVYDKAERRYL